MWGLCCPSRAPGPNDLPRLALDDAYDVNAAIGEEDVARLEADRAAGRLLLFIGGVGADDLERVVVGPVEGKAPRRAIHQMTPSLGRQQSLEFL